MASICKPLKIEVDDKVGKLADLTAKLKAQGLNIEGIVAWTQEGAGHAIIRTSDNEKACQAVKGDVKSCSFGECICVQLDDKPGTLEAASRKLAEAGISIHLVYATSCGCGKVTVSLHTSDNQKAAKLL